MSIPPGAPATTQMANYGNAQPQYNVPAQGLVGVGYQSHTVPGGPGGYQPPTMHSQQPQPTPMYMPASSAAPQQPPQPGAAEYQPYNMQGMYW